MCHWPWAPESGASALNHQQFMDLFTDLVLGTQWIRNPQICSCKPTSIGDPVYSITFMYKSGRRGVFVHDLSFYSQMSGLIRFCAGCSKRKLPGWGPGSSGPCLVLSKELPDVILEFTEAGSTNSLGQPWSALVSLAPCHLVMGKPWVAQPRKAHLRKGMEINRDHLRATPFTQKQNPRRSVDNLQLQGPARRLPHVPLSFQHMCLESNFPELPKACGPSLRAREKMNLPFA